MEGYARMGAIDTAFPSTSATPYATLGSATGSSFGQTPYSWQLSHPLASIATRGTDVAAMNRPAFLYDANCLFFFLIRRNIFGVHLGLNGEM